MLLISRVKGAAHQHIPDYLLITKTGPLVVDVKARDMLNEPTVADTLAWLVVSANTLMAYHPLGAACVTSMPQAAGLTGVNRRSSMSLSMISALPAGTSRHSPGRSAKGSDTTTRVLSLKWASRSFSG